MAEKKNDDQNGTQDDGVFDYEDLIKGLSGDEESGDEDGGAEEAVNLDDIAIDEIIGDDVEETRAEATAGVPKIDGDAEIDLSHMFDDLDEMARDSVTDEVETEPQPKAPEVDEAPSEDEDEMPVFDKSIELEVKKLLSGELKESTPKAKVTKMATGVARVNPASELVWQISLDAGAEAKMEYAYRVLARP